MIETNVREAKARLSSYLSDVENGEEVLIVRRGKPVAVLKPVGEVAPLPSMKDFRQKINLRGLPASECIVRIRQEARY